MKLAVRVMRTMNSHSFFVGEDPGFWIIRSIAYRDSIAIHIINLERERERTVEYKGFV